jgi:formylmethanofuran dehydrogenase subunit C
MPLTFKSRIADRIPLSWRGLIPSSIASHNQRELRQRTISYGNGEIALGECFDISGDPSDGEWRLEGDFSSVHHIGAGMSWGTIHAAGPLGRHVGSGMTGGRIVAEQDVGDHLGVEMRGGLLSVGGNAGDHVGAAHIGSKSGMRGGTIVVAGNVGTHAGYAMRRGTVIVAGNCGDWPAYRMRGGTLIVGGVCGERPGAELRRGTIVLAGEVPRLLPTFRHACQCRPGILSLLEREFSSLNVSLPFDSTKTFKMYNGDQNEAGRGELFVLDD